MKTFKPIIVFILMLLVVDSATAQEVQSVVRSPLGGIAVGPSGLATAVIHTRPYCCPSTALEVYTDEIVGEENLQWVLFGFSVPIEKSMREISGVEVCYEIKSDLPGRTYISQTRLTDMSTPDAAYVQVDDSTDRTELGPQCYISNGHFKPDGSVALHLKVVFGDPDDTITIGSTRLLITHSSPPLVAPMMLLLD
ncbi:MAG: hypothetical protein WGN25_16485 [Candidatus Electrothrix sp. GW3-4]|uniref:hypothetical protein n=1 Tax=Candidatus Electrothrix sp. GW3-4 TaxID=3126740 RepID=UPI0030D26972